MTDIGDLGRYGETEFKRWCVACGLVVNGSLEQDATGWDCKVEYKKLIQNNTLNPLQPESSLSHPIFDIQVKTTESSKNKWSIKLEHLVRFANSPHPAFICIINADMNKALTNHIYLIHIDKKWIAKILKKHRKFAKSNKNIYGHTMNISGTDNDLIKDNFHKAIADRFKDVLGDSLQEYSKIKNNIIQKIGHEGNPGTFKFKSSFDSINNNILGLSNSASIENVLITDNRFGIPMEMKMAKALLEFSADELDANLAIICNGIQKMSLMVKVRKSLFEIDESSSIPYATILHEAFKIVFYRTEIKFVPNTINNKTSIKYCKIYSQLRACMDGSCIFNLNMNLSMFEIPFHYDYNPTIVNDSKKFGAQIWLLEEIEKLDLGITEIDMKQIMQQGAISSIAYMINNENEEIAMTFIPNNMEHINTLEYTKDGEMLFCLVFYIGDKSFCYFYKISSIIFSIDKEIKIKSLLSNINFLECCYVQEDEYDTIEELWDEMYKKYSIVPFFKNEMFCISFDHASLEY